MEAEATSLQQKWTDDVSCVFLSNGSRPGI